MGEKKEKSCRAFLNEKLSPWQHRELLPFGSGLNVPLKSLLAGHLFQD